jgi:signal peptide peptidase SppA
MKNEQTSNNRSANILLSGISDAVWAMNHDAWGGILALAAGHANTDPEAKPPKLPTIKGSLAIVPVVGVIAQHASWYSDVSTDRLGRTLDDLMADASVGAIVLNFDSPGGVVYGTPELGEKIRGYRGNGKSIYAVANATAFSAAYWLASQAEKLFVIPSGQVGSIGVWSAHVDISGYEEKLGIKTTLVSAGKYKVEGHPWEPLGDEAREEMQREVDMYHGMFIDAVAKGRGVKTSIVREQYGQGRLIEASRAVEIGMADGIATLDEVVGSLARSQRDRKTSVENLRLAEARVAIQERD